MSPAWALRTSAHGPFSSGTARIRRRRALVRRGGGPGRRRRAEIARRARHPLPRRTGHLCRVGTGVPGGAAGRLRGRPRPTGPHGRAGPRSGAPGRWAVWPVPRWAMHRWERREPVGCGRRAGPGRAGPRRWGRSRCGAAGGRASGGSCLPIDPGSGWCRGPRNCPRRTDDSRHATPSGELDARPVGSRVESAVAAEHTTGSRPRIAHGRSPSASTAERTITIGQRQSAHSVSNHQRGRECAGRDSACDRRSLCVRSRTALAVPAVCAPDWRGPGDTPRATASRRPAAVDSTPRPTHLADLVAAAAARHADHPALVDAATGATLIWAEFDATVSAESRRLTDAGVSAGDRVVIRCASGPPLAVAVLGALRAGAVAVPVRARRRRPGRRPLRTPAGRDRRAGVGARRRHRRRSARSRRPRRARRRGRRRRGHRAARLHLRRARRLPVAPRGAGQPGAGGGAAPGPRHPGGPGAPGPAALPLLRAGRRSVPGLLGRGDRRPAGPRAARTPRSWPTRWRGTGSAGSPACRRPIARCSSWIRTTLRTALAGLRLCTCGGVPLPRPWATAFQEATGHRIVEGYGLTEAGPVVTSTPIDGVRVAGLGGASAAGGRAAAVDGDGRPLATPRAAAAAGRLRTHEAEPAAGDARSGPTRTGTCRGPPGRGGAPLLPTTGRSRGPAPGRPTCAPPRAGSRRTSGRWPSAASRSSGPSPSAVSPRSVPRPSAPRRRSVRRPTGVRVGDPVGDMIDDAQDVEGPADPASDAGPHRAARAQPVLRGTGPDRTGGPAADGWFVTSDMGFLDGSGELHLVDRSSDLVVVSGFTVYPHEVERVLGRAAGRRRGGGGRGAGRAHGPGGAGGRGARAGCASWTPTPCGRTAARGWPGSRCRRRWCSSTSCRARRPGGWPATCSADAGDAGLTRVGGRAGMQHAWNAAWWLYCGPTAAKPPCGRAEPGRAREEEGQRVRGGGRAAAPRRCAGDRLHPDRLPRVREGRGRRRPHLRRAGGDLAGRRRRHRPRPARRVRRPGARDRHRRP